MSCLWDAQGTLKCQNGAKQIYNNVGVETFTSLPSGSYQQTCRKCTTTSSQYLLNNCECQTKSGVWKKNGSFKAGECIKQGKAISNNNGKLTC